VPVELTRFKHYKLCDISLWYEPENSQERLPSKKGFAIQQDRLGGLIEVLQEAKRMSEKITD
jgi:hypothetical protein